MGHVWSQKWTWRDPALLRSVSADIPIDAAVGHSTHTNNFSSENRITGVFVFNSLRRSLDHINLLALVQLVMRCFFLRALDLAFKSTSRRCSWTHPTLARPFLGCAKLSVVSHNVVDRSGANIEGPGDLSCRASAWSHVDDGWSFGLHDAVCLKFRSVLLAT